MKKTINCKDCGTRFHVNHWKDMADYPRCTKCSSRHYQKMMFCQLSRIANALEDLAARHGEHG